MPITAGSFCSPFFFTEQSSPPQSLPACCAAQAHHHRDQRIGIAQRAEIKCIGHQQQSAMTECSSASEFVARPPTPLPADGERGEDDHQVNREHACTVGTRTQPAEQVFCRRANSRTQQSPATRNQTHLLRWKCTLQPPGKRSHKMMPVSSHANRFQQVGRSSRIRIAQTTSTRAGGADGRTQRQRQVFEAK